MVPKKITTRNYIDRYSREKVNELNDRIDELEAKNYQLKCDIDRIIKAIEYYKLEVLK